MKKIILLIFACISFSGFAQIINTIAGSTTTCGYSGDGGPALSAQVCVRGITTDAAGNIFFTDWSTGAHIRKIDLMGIITTIAGTGTTGYTGDGGLATAAQLYYPTYITTDPQGDIYFVDGGTRIRKINSSGTISTIAGNGTFGYSGDGGPAIGAQLGYISAIAANNYNVYIVDASNFRIRKIDYSGTITTIAGTGVAGFSGDGGPAISAQFCFMTSESYAGGIATDANDNVFIADYCNGRIRKIDMNGDISTIAGTGTFGYNGDGGLATSAAVFVPSYLSLDGQGNLYIATSYTNTSSGGVGYWNPASVREITTNGIINTIAGNGSSGIGGDGGPATAAQLDSLYSFAVSPCGDIILPDRFIIRKVSSCVTSVAQIKLGSGLSVYPVPAKNSLSVSVEGNEAEVKIYNLTGALVLSCTVKQKTFSVDITSLSSGIYFLQAGASYSKFVKE